MFSANPDTPEAPARARFGGHCVWCNPKELQQRCFNDRKRLSLVQLLKQLYKVYQPAVVFAGQRLPQYCNFLMRNDQRVPQIPVQMMDDSESQERRILKPCLTLERITATNDSINASVEVQMSVPKTAVPQRS